MPFPPDPSKPLTKAQRWVLQLLAGGNVVLQKEQYKYSINKERNRDPEKHCYRVRVDGTLTATKIRRMHVDRLRAKGYLTANLNAPEITPAGVEAWRQTDRLGRWLK